MESIAKDESFQTCPVCMVLTGSLKQYRYVSWFLFLFVIAVWRFCIYRACPACMRRFIWRQCLFNLGPANFAWFFSLFPWAICLTAVSYIHGHSRSVEKGISPLMEMAQDGELSWGRVFAFISVLAFWAPGLGFLIAILAYSLNRRSPSWTFWASKWTLIISGIEHAVLAGIMGFAAIQR